MPRRACAPSAWTRSGSARRARRARRVPSCPCCATGSRACWTRFPFPCGCAIRISRWRRPIASSRTRSMRPMPRRRWGRSCCPASWVATWPRARSEGRAQTTRTHAVVAGARRLLGVTEQGLDDAGGLIGCALDYTDVEEAEAERDRHIAAHREVLERLAIPIVVYGADMRVRFFNRAYVHAWQFEESWLEAGPTVTEVIDRLRERRLIPEAADFPAYKREKVRQFTSLLEPVEEFLHLPDGRAIRLTTAPHPLGGLILTFEDLTDRLALERSYNTLIAVQRETLDNLYEGIAVFGGDGRLKLWNPAFARMWGLDADALAGEPHVTKLMARTTRFFRRGNGA
ncbi:MAG: PAS domain-containing protein, partial [Alphaproteobacteria bacterium]|nr:PAS domain-containing protein [Alphaproteobacteria bacterium]